MQDEVYLKCAAISKDRDAHLAHCTFTRTNGTKVGVFVPLDRVSGKMVRVRCVKKMDFISHLAFPDGFNCHVSNKEIMW